MKIGHLTQRDTESILERWLEYEHGTRAAVLEAGGGTWKGESDRLLWTITVGCKVNKTPRLPIDPGNPYTRHQSAVEQVAKLRMEETSLSERIGQLTSNLSRTKGHASADEYSAALAFRRELEDAARYTNRRLEQLLVTPQYRTGMDYLQRELFRCILVDNTFLVFAARAQWDNDTRTERFQRLFAMYRDLTNPWVAKALNVSLRTVKYWRSGSIEIPAHRLDELQAVICARAACPSEQEQKLEMLDLVA